MRHAKLINIYFIIALSSDICANDDNKKSVIKVKEYFLNNKIDIDLIVLNESCRTAVDAANSLNKEVGSIVKSLLVKDEIKNKFYLCLVSGDKYMSLYCSNSVPILKFISVFSYPEFGLSVFLL